MLEPVLVKGDTIRIGPWTYRICQVHEQAEGVLVNMMPIEKEE